MTYAASRQNRPPGGVIAAQCWALRWVRVQNCHRLFLLLLRNLRRMLPNLIQNAPQIDNSTSIEL